MLLGKLGAMIQATLLILDCNFAQLLGPENRRLLALVDSSASFSYISSLVSEPWLDSLVE